jgi:hypothetical protein
MKETLELGASKLPQLQNLKPYLLARDTKREDSFTQG